MKIDYKKEYKLDYSLLDENLKLKPFEAFNFAQNTVTEYFKMFNGDNVTVRKKDNAMWVVTKTRIHFYKSLTWLDKVIAHSYTTKIKPIRVETETSFKDCDGNLVFVANQQSCPLDIDTKKIRKVSSVSYPNSLEEDKSLYENDFKKLNEEFTIDDKVYSQTIYSQDIDYSKHVNNSIYIRYIMNSLSNEFLNKIFITDIQINYISESKEGDILDIYKKKNNDNTIDFMIKRENKEIVRAQIIYQPVI